MTASTTKLAIALFSLTVCLCIHANGQSAGRQATRYTWSYARQFPPTRTHTYASSSSSSSSSPGNSLPARLVPGREYYLAYPPPPALPNHPAPLFGGRLPLGSTFIQPQGGLFRPQFGPIQPQFLPFRPSSSSTSSSSSGSRPSRPASSSAAQPTRTVYSSAGAFGENESPAPPSVELAPAQPAPEQPSYTPLDLNRPPVAPVENPRVVPARPSAHRYRPSPYRRPQAAPTRVRPVASESAAAPELLPTAAPVPASSTVNDADIGFEAPSSNSDSSSLAGPVISNNRPAPPALAPASSSASGRSANVDPNGFNAAS